MESTPQGRADDSPAPWSVRVLGDLELRIGERRVATGELGSPKQRRLFEVLLLERGRWVAIDRLVDILWDAPPHHARRQVATLVSRLRAVIGRAAVEAGRDAYRLTVPEGSEIDLVTAERLVADANLRFAAGEVGPALAAAERAAALLGRGAPLGDEPYATWLEAARTEAARTLRRARHVLWEAALASGLPERALAVAEDATADDPLDEEAHRAIMHAHLAAGAPARAVAAFERLRSLLEDELGVAPAAETEALRAALADGRDPRAVGAAPSAPDRALARPAEAHRLEEPRDPTFVGRDAELRRLEAARSAISSGGPRLVLVIGEAGIGKSTLVRRALSSARGAGALVLEARCYAAERSLFLQPVLDALRPLIVRSSPQALAAILGEGAPHVARLIPEVGAAIEVGEPPPTTPELEHRRAVDAVAGVLRTLARRQDVVLALDDLQNAGAATLEFLHYLARRSSTQRLLVLATLRLEVSDDALRVLGEIAERVTLGPLPSSDVRRLASAMGCPDVDEALLERAGGHPLFVVEMLRSVGEREGSHAIPPSLRTAVLGRVEGAGHDVGELLAAAAVLGSRFSVADVAALVGVGVQEAIRTLELAHRARLVGVRESEYVFANDLVHEILYEAMPLPVRVERHRAAGRRPGLRAELLARHAHAAGDWVEAARAHLAAAAEAADAFANLDAERLLDAALESARRAGDEETEVRALLERGRVRERLARFADAVSDHTGALSVARHGGHRSLELQALRELGGDPAVALGRRIPDCVTYLEEARVLADDLGDVAGVVDTMRRLAILDVNRLEGARARRWADEALRRAGAATTAGTGTAARIAARIAALDASKSVAAYTGDLATLEATVAELEPLLEREGRLLFLQWTTFESALVPFGRGDPSAAAERVERALDLNRKSGYHAYEGTFRAVMAWIDDVRGERSAALEGARRASAAAAASRHPWWVALADAILGRLLLQVEEHEGARAALERGLAAADGVGADLHALACLGPLAATYVRVGDAEAAGRAARRVEELTLDAARGPLFLFAGHTPLLAARALLELGAVPRASRLLDRLEAALRERPWTEFEARAAELRRDLDGAAKR